MARDQHVAIPTTRFVTALIGCALCRASVLASSAFCLSERQPLWIQRLVGVMSSGKRVSCPDLLVVLYGSKSGSRPRTRSCEILPSRMSSN